jgi:hypothetical protein
MQLAIMYQHMQAHLHAVVEVSTQAVHLVDEADAGHLQMQAAQHAE